MEKFSAEEFFNIASLLQALRIIEVEEPVIQKDSRLATDWLPKLRKSCDSIGLHLSSKHIVRIIERLDTGKVQPKEFQENMLLELQHRMTDEMEDQLFMYLPPDQAEFYNQAELFGKDVNTKFSTTQFDIVEAGNCYASGRGTATVFHLMRIMEVAVQEFGAKLGVSLVGKKNWQNILDETNKAIGKLPKSPQAIVMSQASANLYAVKLAWRNEVMHPKDTYTLEEAENLIRQVKIFMEQLAKIV
jgi:hypothetical protein